VAQLLSPRRRRAFLALTAVLLLAACVPPVGGRTTQYIDERWDYNARPRGEAVLIGDSVGWGLTTQGLATLRMVEDGWGKIRSYTQLGLHAAPESATDPHTVVNWFGVLKGMGFQPRVTVIVSGANDVGYPQANVVARNVQRIETAMRAMGDTQVVWLTIVHPFGGAWNQALADVDTRWPNFHLCDWAAQVRANPHYLERDGVHMTVGPNGGYVAMARYVVECARAAVGG
jgi:hypothetical protein